MTSKLFEPLQVGNVQLQHRLVMAPLTRYRADDNHVPLEFVKEYYSQRASVPGTLLITEATFISSRASGYPNVPGIWNQAQIDGWKEVTDAVHAKKSFIYLQLWALGRAANAGNLRSKGERVVAPSAIPISSDRAAPEVLTEEEIWGFVADYATAAKNAVAAGFDGVEIHGANGYLIDQFTQDVSNVRTDKWGGSIENRARFGLEVAKAIVEAIGSERVGYRISPFSTFQSMKMDNPIPQFSYLIEGLKKLKLAYLHVVESRVSGNADVEEGEKSQFAVELWDNTSPVFLAGGFGSASAKRAVDQDYKNYDVGIVFGRYFISNPDLVFRIQHDIELAPYNRDTFYKVKSTEGYLDYPFTREFATSKA